MEENVTKSTWSGAPMISSESGSDTLKKFTIQYLLRLKLLKPIPGTRYLGYRFGSVSNQSEPARKTWLERWSTLKSGHKRKRHKRVSGANYRRHLISLRRSWLQPGCSLLTGNNTFFFPSTFNDFEMGSEDETSILFDEMQNKENSDLQQVQPLRVKPVPLFETTITKYPDHVWPFFCKHCLYITTVYVVWFKKNRWFHFITILLKNYWNTFLVSLPVLLQIAANFCMFYFHIEEKSDTTVKPKTKSLWRLVLGLLFERQRFFRSWGT